MRADTRLAGAVVLWLLPLAAGAISLELPTFYQSPQALGMGGADVAVGGEPTSVFSNPAGLARMRYGWQSQPLVATIGLSRRTRRFVSEAQEALDAQTAEAQRSELAEVVRRFRGENLYNSASLLPTVSWRGRAWAFSAIWFGSARFDGRTRQGFGDAGLISVDARTFSGPVLSAAHFSGQWALGVNVKSLRQRRVREDYSVRELVEITDAGDSITDDAVSGRAHAIDFGVQYELAPGYQWQPRFGAVVQNVGDLDFGAPGRIPETVIIGLSVRPPAPRTASLRLAIEYFDVLHEVGEDRDRLKRLRLGAEWRLWDRRWHGLALRAGLYQGTATAGIDLRIPGLRLGLTTYAEEQGAFAGQERDRRYLLTVGLGV